MQRHSEDHPTRNEDEYFARENAELIKQMRVKLDTERLAKEKNHHFMKCPKCGSDLQEREFEHVKADVCDNCHGVWLDQGELEMLRHIQQSRGPAARIMGDILGIFHKSR